METINTILAVALVLSLAVNIWLFTKTRNSSDVLAEVVSANEIYPLFVCPCCGRTIDAGCCPMATERTNYVDALVEAGISKDKVITAYVKKYGIDSFKDENKKEEFREKLVEEAPDKRPIIVISPDSYDFGNVSQKKGIAITLFEIRNEGKDDLVIDGMETSCGCTTASIIYNGEEGPKFGMPGHGLNEKIGDWQVAIPADPIDFEKKVKIELNQVD